MPLPRFPLLPSVEDSLSHAARVGERRRIVFLPLRKDKLLAQTLDDANPIERRLHPGRSPLGFPEENVEDLSSRIVPMFRSMG